MSLSKKDFKITPFETKTLVWWLNRRNKIDMSPSYQRHGRLWSIADKAYLIDSILNGYDVPKLYIADFTWTESVLNKKRLPYAIIDGKQRLEAIFGFFDGDIVLNEDFVYLDNPSLKLSGLGYKDLKQLYPDIAEIFDNYSLSIMSVITNSEKPISELFVRLNRSKPLTGAEIRNAMVGLAPEIIRNISGHEFFSVNIKFSISRGQDKNLAAKVLLFEYFGEVCETKKNNLDEFVKTTDCQDDTILDRLQLSGRLVIDGLDNMGSIFLPNDSLLSNPGIIPVYYWFIRDIDKKTYQFVRPFLVEFEHERKTNRDFLTNNPNANVDSQLIEYDNFNRNTNDSRSHGGRVKILHERFMIYIHDRRSR
jgi:hypothetical protein